MKTLPPLSNNNPSLTSLFHFPFPIVPLLSYLISPRIPLPSPSPSPPSLFHHVLTPFSLITLPLSISPHPLPLIRLLLSLFPPACSLVNFFLFIYLFFSLLPPSITLRFNKFVLLPPTHLYCPQTDVFVFRTKLQDFIFRRAFYVLVNFLISTTIAGQCRTNPSPAVPD
jgi:hypothetical protein